MRQRKPDFPDAGRIAAVLDELDALLGRLDQASDRAAINGLEGRGAAIYFEALGEIIPSHWAFEARNRQPPRDPFNALLSLGYTILYAHADTILRAHGLLPWLGAYHQPRGRHAALASDMIEPFRHLVERVALKMVTQPALQPGDFQMDPDDGCRLYPDARRRYLAAIADRLATPIQSIAQGEPRDAIGHLRTQAAGLVAWLRGDVHGFLAFRQR